MKSKTDQWPFEIGQKVIAPLNPIPLGVNNHSPDIRETILYPGYVIEIPKPNSAKHGNSERVLVFKNFVFSLDLFIIALLNSMFMKPA